MIIGRPIDQTQEQALPGSTQWAWRPVPWDELDNQVRPRRRHILLSRGCASVKACLVRQNLDLHHYNGIVSPCGPRELPSFG